MRHIHVTRKELITYSTKPRTAAVTEMAQQTRRIVSFGGKLILEEISACTNIIILQTATDFWLLSMTHCRPDLQWHRSSMPPDEVWSGRGVPSIYMLIELLTSEMEHPQMKALKSFSTELVLLVGRNISVIWCRTVRVSSPLTARCLFVTSTVNVELGHGP